MGATQFPRRHALSHISRTRSALLAPQSLLFSPAISVLTYLPTMAHRDFDLYAQYCRILEGDQSVCCILSVHAP